MGRLVILENFDASGRSGGEPEPDEGPQPGFDEGYAAGRAEALAEAEAAQDRLSERLVETLSQMSFGYAEARLDLMQSLRPLLTAIAERLLPTAAQAALAPWLIERVLEAAESDLSRPVLIEVSAAEHAPVAALAATVPGLAAELRVAPDLESGQARLATDESETMLDLAGLVAALQAALAALFDDMDQQERRSFNE